MNEDEKNVMTILTLARIVESSLWYCLPPRDANGFSKDERTARFKALTALTAEGTPFDQNCRSNGDLGKDFHDSMGYFIEDVYADPGRIVTVDIHGTVQVEQSLIIDLFTAIVRLRGYLESFLKAADRFLSGKNELDPEFDKLVQTDTKYFHSFAGKIATTLLANKFLELNQNANTYTESYSKNHGGIDPHQDPEFNVRNDPSFRMLENEFHALNQDLVDVLNSYGQDDDEFRYARDQVYSDCDIFTGKKQTTDTQAFFQLFTSYFDKILLANQNVLNDMFRSEGDVIQDYETKRQAVAPQGDAAPEEEKK
jgi:hypothetical protein